MKIFRIIISDSRQRVVLSNGKGVRRLQLPPELVEEITEKVETWISSLSQDSLEQEARS